MNSTTYRRCTDSTLLYYQKNNYNEATSFISISSTSRLHILLNIWNSTKLSSDYWAREEKFWVFKCITNFSFQILPWFFQISQTTFKKRLINIIQSCVEIICFITISSKIRFISSKYLKFILTLIGFLRKLNFEVFGASLFAYFLFTFEYFKQILKNS